MKSKTNSQKHNQQYKIDFFKLIEKNNYTFNTNEVKLVQNSEIETQQDIENFEVQGYDMRLYNNIMYNTSHRN